MTSFYPTRFVQYWLSGNETAILFHEHIYANGTTTDWDALWTMQVVEKTIRPCLVELSEDPDVDVRFFATQALQSSDQVMMST